MAKITGDQIEGGTIGPDNLEPTAVTPGTYGDDSNVAQITIDQDGRITAATEVAITGSGGLPPDGDYGDITVSSDGATWTVDDGVISNAKLANVATDTIKGRATTGTGAPEDLTALPFAFTGDVTRAADSNAQVIPNDTVTYAKMQNISAADRLLGRGNGGGAGDVQEIALGSNLTLSGTTLNATGGGTITVGEDGDTPISNVDTIIFDGATVTDDTGGQVTVTITGDVPASLYDAGVSLVIDGGGEEITTGTKFDFVIPWDGDITAWEIIADISGDIEIDILTAAYASFPGSAASIWGGSEPAISGAAKNQATGLSVSVVKGNWYRVTVNSIDTIGRCTLALTITRT